MSPSQGALPRKLSPLTGSGTPNTRIMADFSRGIYSSPLETRGTEEAVLTGKMYHRPLQTRDRVLSAPHGLNTDGSAASPGAALMLKKKTKVVRSSSMGGDATDLAPSKHFIYQFPLWQKNATSTGSGPSGGDALEDFGGGDGAYGVPHEQNK